MSSLQSLRPTVTAPGRVHGRLIERRRRSQGRQGTDEHLVLYLCLAPFVALGDGALTGAARFLRRLRAATLPRLERLADVPPQAESVRVEGSIVPLGPGFETPGHKAPAVFARSIFVVPTPYRRDAATYTDETRGTDFCIRLPSGETISVFARDVRLEDPPRPSRAPNLAELARRGSQVGERGRPMVREAVLRPGDRIEVYGVLIRQVAPQGHALLGRGTPLITRLVPPSGASHLWVRRLGNSARADS